MAGLWILRTRLCSEDCLSNAKKKGGGFPPPQNTTVLQLPNGLPAIATLAAAAVVSTASVAAVLTAAIAEAALTVATITPAAIAVAAIIALAAPALVITLANIDGALTGVSKADASDNNVAPVSRYAQVAIVSRVRDCL